jgi:hypothetical protein
MGRPKGSKNTPKVTAKPKPGVDYAVPPPDPVVEEAVAAHFEKLEGFKDEYDRKVEGQREAVHEAALRGVDTDEVIERELDRSMVRSNGPKGKSWLQSYRLKWVNRKGKDGLRVTEHEGKGFFIVKPGEDPVKPVCGLKHEETWIQGDLVLMAETMQNYERRRRRSLYNLAHQSGQMREGTREEINKLIRDESGLPHAAPGITRSRRDNTWDELTTGSPIEGPSGKGIAATE